MDKFLLMFRHYLNSLPLPYEQERQQKHTSANCFTNIDIYSRIQFWK